MDKGSIESSPGARARFLDFVNIKLARSHFKRGSYARALSLYRKVGPGKHAAKARQMIDWIGFKFGDVERGWPAYPGVGFEPDIGVSAQGAPEGPILVKDPQQPHEVVNALGLRPWDPEAPRDLPVLVWYNFKQSLGVEVFATKIAKAFQRKYGLRLALVVDSRVLEIVRLNFPDALVLPKDLDISALRGNCSHFIMARDMLSKVVRTEADFGAIAEQTLATEGMPGPACDAKRRIAISWKTTNKRQGPYRNIPLEGLTGLLGSLDMEYHSAQHGVTGAERDFLTNRLGKKIRFDTIDPSGTAYEIASALRRMDAVVTIDNSVLHIAGSYDIPTYALLSVPAYWAWPVTGRDSRWYRSVSLLHQEVPRRWDIVLERLRTEIC